MRCSPAVNVGRLRPFFEGAGGEPAPGRCPTWETVGQEGEYEVELLINRRLVRGVPRYPAWCVWRSHTSESANDE